MDNWAHGCAPLNAVVIFVALEIVLRTSVSLHLDWSNFRHLSVLYLASAVPFFITGLLFSVVFARHPARITQLYGADLLGGSLACLALVPLLNFIGGPNTILFAAAGSRGGGRGLGYFTNSPHSRNSRAGLARTDRGELSRQAD